MNFMKMSYGSSGFTPAFGDIRNVDWFRSLASSHRVNVVITNQLDLPEFSRVDYVFSTEDSPKKMVGSQFCPEGKTYCLLGMVCAAISTDVGDSTVVEESSNFSSLCAVLAPSLPPSIAPQYPCDRTPDNISYQIRVNYPFLVGTRQKAWLTDKSGKQKAQAQFL